MTTLLSVNEALSLIRAQALPLAAERIAIGAAKGRVLARDVAAAIDQPPFRASAMDGYAVRFADASAGASLRLIGQSAAGAPFAGGVDSGETVRIFTGAVVPAGADHVVIQEDTTTDGGLIVIAEKQARKSNVRAAGIDFTLGALLKRQGARLSPFDLGLIAAANIAAIDAVQKPIIAFFDNGDELNEPGAALSAGQIIGSNRFAIGALIADWGGIPRYLGRAPDNREAIAQKFRDERGAHVIVAIGGASVGDRDHLRAAFGDAGGAIIFSKVSVKPGKPTWFGRMGSTYVLGLPGNPASALVCAVLFLRPLLAAMTGEDGGGIGVFSASLSSPLGANGPRETYLRALATGDPSARLIVSVHANQDSSLLSPLAAGNCLVRRAAHAAAAPAGELVECVSYAALQMTGEL